MLISAFTCPDAFYFYRRDHPCFLTLLSKLFNDDDEMAEGACRKEYLAVKKIPNLDVS